MVHFVGAGPGAPDLITVRGKQYLEEADVCQFSFGQFTKVLKTFFPQFLIHCIQIVPTAVHLNPVQIGNFRFSFCRNSNTLKS